MTPLISFVIPVRNDADGLARCLASISGAAGLTPVECVVVDNGSVDGSDRVATRAGCTVLRVPHEKVGELRNRGAAAATAALLAFVDADHELSPAWVATVLDAMADTTVAAVGAPYRPPPDGNWIQRGYNGLRDHRPGRHRVEWLGSGNLVVRAGVFQRIGGFDPSLEACEDVDLCRRIREEGGVILSDARLESTHHGDPASLGAIFRGELWRGRNNLQVSFRERPSLRALPSVLIPIGQLVLIAAVPLTLSAGYPRMAATGLAALAIPTALRAFRLAQRSRVNVLQALSIVGSYDLARALALVWRARHRRADRAALATSP